MEQITPAVISALGLIVAIVITAVVGNRIGNRFIERNFQTYANKE